jgi:glycosyltransferase involved in cell wall biosynthesis
LLGETLLLYSVFDEHTQFARGWRRRRRLQDEATILARADIVFTTSKNLCATRIKKNPNTYFIPNGVDFEHFAAASKGNLDLPNELEGIGKPLIGFVGKINDKIDFGIIRALATTHPEWAIVMVGPDDRSYQSLLRENEDYLQVKESANVHFIGPVPYERLPSIVRAFSVCVIPFVIDRLTVNIYPRKFHEYMATGKPIVTTPLPDLEPYEELVGISRSRDDFVTLVEQALADRDEGLSQKRKALARENSWDRLAENMLSIIDETLRNKG